MTGPRSATFLEGLVRELLRLPSETEWVEFKVNNADLQAIGEYISALANSAALAGKTNAYLVWGASDARELVGTKFAPRQARKGNEELESWLLRLLTPRIEFRFLEVEVDEHPVVILEIERAAQHPVAFAGVEYVRVGSSKRKLKAYPEKDRALWRIFDQAPFEQSLAAEGLSAAEITGRLDYPRYFSMLDIPLPANRGGILSALERDLIIQRDEAGRYGITNLGALAFAADLSRFPGLRRKQARVVLYAGRDRLNTIREKQFSAGYAVAFDSICNYVDEAAPATEVLDGPLRTERRRFPSLAVRELVANALIHQDLAASGSNPMIEVFENRLEVTNPGEPLVETARFLDSPPRSRNEALASLMRRIGVCEERGSGIDKVVSEVERYQLPAPLFSSPPGFTRVVLFAARPFAEMDRQDRIRACYLHACLQYTRHEYLTNASLRARFGVDEKRRAAVSRVIRDAVEAGVVVPHDETAPKYRKYVPEWAGRERRPTAP